MLLALVALVAAVTVVGLTAVWQRQARYERRLTHVENEVGLTEAERSHAEELPTLAKKPHSASVRARLHVHEKLAARLDRRLGRIHRSR